MENSSNGYYEDEHGNVWFYDDEESYVALVSSHNPFMYQDYINTIEGD